MASKLIPAHHRVPAWLSEGSFVQFDEPVDPAVAIEMSGLDTPVTTHPIYSHDGSVIADKVETWRDNRHMSIVGKGTYHVIEFTAILPFLRALLVESDYEVQAAGKWDHGRKEMMVFHWPETLTVHGEEFGGFGYVANSHDGSRALSFATGLVRLACTNQVTAMMKGNVLRLRHTASWDRGVEQARESLGIRLSAQDTFVAEMERDLKIGFSDSQFQQFIDSLAPLKDDNNLPKTGRGLTMALNTRDTLGASWNAPDLANVRNTLYGAKQAAVAFYDWGYGSDKRRGESSLDGATDRLKVAAVKRLEAIAI